MIMKENNLVGTKDICAKFNISYSTVNYYTNLGLLKVVRRKGNRRLYDSSEVEEKINKISQLRYEGYPLHLIYKKLKQK